MEKRIHYLSDVLKLGIKPDEFCFAQSAWLACLGLRPNSDLDIVLRPDVFKKYKPMIDRLSKVDLKINSKKFAELGCMNDEQLFKERVVEINGYLFSDLAFYMNLLHKRLKQNIKVEKSKHILQLLKTYFKEYKTEYLITEEVFNETKQNIGKYLI